MDNRVVFYGPHDMSIAFYLDSVKKKYDAFTEDASYSINDVLELYSCALIVETGARKREWIDQDYNHICETNVRVKVYVSKYFNSITDDDLLNNIEQVETKYIELFWKIFELYRLFERISGDTIETLLNSKNTPLYPIMMQKKTVKQYDRIIAEVLRKEPVNAACHIFDTYLKAESQHYFIPNSLKTDEFESFFLAYINSDHPNPNYLELLVNGISTKECPISNDVKFAASEVLDAVYTDLFSNRTPSIQWSITVGFGDNGKSQDGQIQLIKEEIDDFDVKYTLDKNWFEENLDFESILFNIINAFHLVDEMMHCKLVSRPGTHSVIERVFGVKGKTDYIKGTAYNLDNTAAELILVTYCGFLNTKEINIESFIKWYFEEYISNEYGVEGFEFNISSPGTTYLEKNRNLSAELESIVKQWNMFIKDGVINRKKLEMAVNPVDYSSVLGFTKQKYAKVNTNEIKAIERILYSDQSFLSYYPVNQQGYESFVQLITMENAHISDFEVYQQNAINELIDKGFLFITEDGYVKHNLSKYVWLLEDYHNGIIPYYNLELKYNGLASTIREIMKPYIQNGDLIFEDGLLSSLESDYYDYHLNSKKFGNGLKMKNRFSHGNTSSNEEIQKNIYYKYLKLLLIMIIKINDDLWNHFE